MNLTRLQQTVFEVIRQPLTGAERMRSRTADGRNIRNIAEAIIRPSNRLTSTERLEIYNRSYWFRIISALQEDFPGLQFVMGRKAFHKLAIAYLNDCPSVSFTLRDLGSRLESWLQRNLSFVSTHRQLALDMVRLEWAESEAFDRAEFPALCPADLQAGGEAPEIRLQPYVRLLELNHPVDDLLLDVRRFNAEPSQAASSSCDGFKAGRRPLRPRLPAAEKICLVVHRQADVVYFKRVGAQPFALLRAIQQGSALADSVVACRNAGSKSPQQLSCDLAMWFSDWASWGWFSSPCTGEGQE